MQGAYIYARVSTTEQSETGYGLDSQIHQCKNYCTLYGLPIVASATEAASGKNLVRPVLQGLLTKLNPGSTLLVHKLDRITRSVKDLLTLIELSNKGGWHLASVCEKLDTASPNGRFVVHILAAVAELERSLISERTKAGLQEAKRQGKRLGRPPKHLY